MVILVPLFIYIAVASQIATLASLEHPLDSVGTRLRFQLHIHRVPQLTGFPACGGADAGLTRQQVDQPQNIPLGRREESSTFSTLASSLRAKAEVCSWQTRSCGRDMPEKQACSKFSRSVKAEPAAMPKDNSKSQHSSQILQPNITDMCQAHFQSHMNWRGPVLMSSMDQLSSSGSIPISSTFQWNAADFNGDHPDKCQRIQTQKQIFPAITQGIWNQEASWQDTWIAWLCQFSRRNTYV